MKRNKNVERENMSIYIIGDLHLSFAKEKPMNIFGTNWNEHEEKIKKDWIEKVQNEDTVILAGDFSWAMHLEETYLDFKYLESLPGKKVFIKGNHDYWWTTITNMNKFLKENNFSNIEFLYNNSIKIEDKIFVGTRGWNLLEGQNNEKMMNRELARLELSIQDAIKKQENEEIIAIFHYPPISKVMMKNEYTYESQFLDKLKKYNIKKCYYAHLHGKSHIDAVEGNIEGIEFKLISSDYLEFHLEKIDK